MTDLGSAGFRAWLQTTDLRRPVSDYATVLRGTIEIWEKTEDDLRKMRDAGRAYRLAEMATSAHRVMCKDGCDDDGNECDAVGQLWLEEMRARKEFWEVLGP